jgi:hypothetical protein
MSLHPDPIGPVPEETVRVARAAFPKEPSMMTPYLLICSHIQANRLKLPGAWRWSVYCSTWRISQIGKLPKPCEHVSTGNIC